MARKARPIYTFDFETDPFYKGLKPEPFIWGLYTDGYYKDEWHDDPDECIESAVKEISSLPKNAIVYAHNGGKFDYWYLLPYIDSGSIKIVQGRIIKCSINGVELRDSYSIFPMPLAAYKKDEFNYDWLNRDVRHSKKSEIRKYLKGDNVYLHELVTGFIKEFGLKLTIGGAALNELKKLHPFKSLGKSHDERYRPFYYGGRVDYSKIGITKGNIKYYDVHSMYPSVMMDYRHPYFPENVRGPYADYYINPEIIDGRIDNAPENGCYFAKIKATSRGALPIKNDEGILYWGDYTGEFYASGHEIEVALKHGLLDIHSVDYLLVPIYTISFREFVETFYRKRIDAEKVGNKLLKLFFKLILNSAYGKFAQSPDKFEEYNIWNYATGDDYPVSKEGDSHEWEEKWRMDGGATIIFARDLEDSKKPPLYNDVATAASITSAARAKLLDAKAQCTGFLYCDTDSLVISGEMGGDMEITENTLGTWGLEAELSLFACGGKKMYAGHGHNKGGMGWLKGASKGVKVEPETLARAIKRKSIIEWANDAPSFNFNGRGFRFTERSVNFGEK